MKSPLFFLWLYFAITSHLAFAEVTYGGEGCPGATADVSLDSSGGVTLVFDAYDIAISAVGQQRLSCNIAMPLSLPAGYSANFGTVKILGNYDLKSGSSAQFVAEAFFAGGAGPNYNNNFNGESSGSIAQSFTPNVSWTPCNSSPILRLNTSLLVKTIKAHQNNSTIKIKEIYIGKPTLRRCT